MLPEVILLRRFNSGFRFKIKRTALSRLTFLGHGPVKIHKLRFRHRGVFEVRFSSFLSEACAALSSDGLSWRRIVPLKMLSGGVVAFCTGRKGHLASVQAFNPVTCSYIYFFGI